MGIVLDIGGEGRHPLAWNLNPVRVKTFGPDAGKPIPRLILGRAESVPLASGCASVVIAERTPLRRAAIAEMLRLLAPGGLIILRHVRPPHGDPHEVAAAMLGNPAWRRPVRIGRQIVQESVFGWPLCASTVSGGRS